VSVIMCVEQPALQPDFVDTALLGEVCARTGGRLSLFTGPLLQEQVAQRLQQQLLSDLQHVAGSEAVVKLRVGLGFRGVEVLGAGRITEMGEVELSGVSEDASWTFLLAHDSPIKDEDKVHIQLAVLYTTPFTRKRIVRVHNMTLISSDKPTVIFRNVDLEAVACTLMRQAVQRAMCKPPLPMPSLPAPINGEKERKRQEKSRTADKTSDQPRAFLNGNVVDALFKYRAHCSAQSPRGQLILPEALKTLPVYTLGMLKHPALFENRPQSLPQAMAVQMAQPPPQNTPISPTRSPGNRNYSPSASPRSNNTAGLSPAAAAHYLSRVVVRGNERAFELQRMLSLPVQELINSIYPRVYCLLPMFDGQSHVDLYDEDDDNNASNSNSNGNSEESYHSDCDSPGSAASSPRKVRVCSPRGMMDVNFNTSNQVESCMSSGVNRPLKRRHLLRLLSTMNPSAEMMESDQLYLLDDRSCLWLYVGRSVPQSVLEEVFELQLSAPFSRSDTTPLCNTSRIGRRINSFVELLRSTSPYKQEMKVMWADQLGNNVLMNKFSVRLIEDSVFGMMSYVDYLCTMHTAIQDKLRT